MNEPLGHSGDKANLQPIPVPPMNTSAGGMALPMAPLPPGWNEAVDPASGRPYFYNSDTGTPSLYSLNLAKREKIEHGF